MLRDLLASPSESRPPGDFGHKARLFSDPEFERLQAHYPALVKEWTQSGKKRRKQNAKRKKEVVEWHEQASDRMSLLVAQPKSRPRNTEWFSIATPGSSCQGSPVIGSQNDPDYCPDASEEVQFSSMEAYSRCKWCLCVDGVRTCQTCSRSLCTECFVHHKCSLDDVDVQPIAMQTSNEFLRFLTDFEALRAMRTCRRAGFSYARMSKN